MNTDSDRPAETMPLVGGGTCTPDPTTFHATTSMPDGTEYKGDASRPVPIALLSDGEQA